MTPEASVAGAGGALVHLGNGGIQASVQGGDLLTITSLRHDGRELLAAPDSLPAPYLFHGRRAGVTLLHPWANRLAHDEWAFAGMLARLDGGASITRDPHGRAIHGLAVPGRWVVEPDGPTSCRAHAAVARTDAFPFPHEVDVRFRLGPAPLLEVTTTVTASDGPVPVAFGWHPYFLLEDRTGSGIRLPRHRRLRLDGRGIPLGESRDRPGRRLALATPVDDGFSAVGDGDAFVLETRDGSVSVVHVKDYPCAQAFAPLDARVVSLEPMTAPTDALCSGNGLRTATPGSPFTAVFAIELGG